MARILQFLAPHAPRRQLHEPKPEKWFGFSTHEGEDQGSRRYARAVRPATMAACASSRATSKNSAVSSW